MVRVMRFVPEGPPERPPFARCPVTPNTITCASCGHRWTAANAFSAYEQQAVESCPCPDCGAYTLCCRDGPEGPAAEPGAAEGGPALPSRGL
jgi:hypothetical protein